MTPTDRPIQRADADAVPVGAAFVEGRIVPISEARIPLLDWGFLRSDACQDTVSVWRGMFFCLDEHIARFFQSCRNLQLSCPYDEHQLADVLSRLVQHAGLADAYVQMIATRGLPAPDSRDLRTCKNTFLAFCVPYVHITPDSGRGFLDAIISERPRIPASSVPSSIKNYHWIDFELGLLEAYERGGNTVLLTDGNGGVTEGPGFNVFGCRGGELFTPDTNILEGITRNVVLEIADNLKVEVRQRRVTAAELRDADEVFATSTAGGIMPVRSIDGRPLRNVPGPITREVAGIYWKKRETGWRGTPIEARAEIILAELNVKGIDFVTDQSELVTYSAKPNYRTLGPRFGKNMPQVAAAVAALDAAHVAQVLAGGGEVGIAIDGRDHTLAAEDLTLALQPLEGYEVEAESGHAVALQLELDEELRREGLAREIVHAVQNARKEAGLEITDRIELGLGGDAGLLEAAREHQAYLAGEVLATEVEFGDGDETTVTIDGMELAIAVTRI